MNYIKDDIKNIPIYYFNTPQFKTTSISLAFTLKLSKNNYLYGQMLSRMLSKKTKKYNSPEKFADYLSDLYDSKISVECYGSGEILTIMFRVIFLNRKFCEGLDIEREAIQVLEEVVTNPYLINENGVLSFDPEDLEIEKRSMINNIADIYNNKMLYAYVKLLHLMYKDTPTEILLADDKEAINKIFADDLYTFYVEMLKKSEKYYIVMGNISNEQLKKDLLRLSNNINESIDLKLLPIDSSKRKQDFNLAFEETIDEVQTSQSVISMGFFVDTYLYETDYPSILVANGMFGGYFNSALFQIIREEYGLAYSISSSYNALNGSVVVVAGIDQSNYPLCKKLILDVLEKYQNINEDDKTLDMFNKIKKSLISDLQQAEDSRYNQLLELKTKLDFKDNYYDTSLLIKKINDVSIDDVKNSFKKFKLSNVYFLKGNLENN